ncbi:MAG: hypothetical protein WBD02_09890 [Acidimicrobiia bacterium]
MGSSSIELVVGARGLADFRDVLEHLAQIAEVHAEAPGRAPAARVVIGSDALDSRWSRPSKVPTVLVLPAGMVPARCFGQRVIHALSRADLAPNAAHAAAQLRSLALGSPHDPRTRLVDRLAELGETSGDIVRRALARIPASLEERHAS